jgi:hypothetical protein
MADVFLVYHMYFWCKHFINSKRICPKKENSAYYLRDNRVRWREPGQE